MKTQTIGCWILLWAVQANAFGQKTEITVQTGKVIAQTTSGSVTVGPGHRATLTQNADPSITVDDPMVDNLIEIYRWVEEERDANSQRIDFTSIQIIRIDNEQCLKVAGLTEMPNIKAAASDTVRIGLTSILNEPRYYDLEGNLLTFDLDRANERQGYYYVHFPKSVQPGETFKMVCVAKFDASPEEIWKEGPLWNTRWGNCTPNCLNYFRVILPESAIFVDSSRPVTTIDSFDGRVAATIRNYTGPKADGMYQITFLWPAKDGTSLTDLPPKYRGLQDTRNADLAEEYRRQMERILAGEIFNDLSTPLNVLLTNNCAIVNKDKKLYFETTYLLKIDPKRAEGIAKQFDKGQLDKYWCSIKRDFIDELDFLSTPPWPDKPGEHYIHPIYMSRKGSNTRADTLACIYENGKWYRFGNMGNARDTNVSVFRKWLPKSDEEPKAEKPTLDSLPWDNTGPEALDVYQDYVNNDVEYIDSWFMLGIKLVGGGYWDQAFDCFRRCEELHTHEESERYISSLIWQGHVYDIWGLRERALQKYNAALEILDRYKGGATPVRIEDYGLIRHDQWGIVLNYGWIKKRLEDPFTGKMIGK